MNEDLRHRLAKWDAEEDSAREAAGLMSKRRLTAILYSRPDLQRAIWGAVLLKKGGGSGDGNPHKTAPARYPTTETARDKASREGTGQKT